MLLLCRNHHDADGCNEDCIILTMIDLFPNVTSDGSQPISFSHPASWLEVLIVISRAIAAAYTYGGI